MNLLGTSYLANFERGKKFFELSNHLGNVLVTISDRKLQLTDTNTGEENNGGCEIGTGVDVLDVDTRSGETNYTAITEVNLLPGFESNSGDDYAAYVDNSLTTCVPLTPPTVPAQGWYYAADIVNANDYYPGGMLMPGRTFSSGLYRYGFNGKEKDNDIKGEGNQIDYGNRIYDTRIMRFTSVDPLQKKFPSLSSYQFSGNNPIATIDLDGLEPVMINPGTQALVLILQGYGGDPPNGATQAANAYSSTNNDVFAPDGVLNGGIGTSGPKLQIAVYASSQSNNTKTDVLSTIKNFRSINPDGKVIVVGHSGGGDNLIELAKDNRSVTFDLLITLDTQDPKIYGIDDNNVYKNVKNAINYYQTSEAIGGETLDFKSKETKGANILSLGSNHRSIDNDQLDNVMSDINNFLTGKDAVKIAKERIQPTYNPANSNSSDVFAPGDTKGNTKGSVNPKSTRDNNNKSKSSKANKKPGG